MASPLFWAVEVMLGWLIREASSRSRRKLLFARMSPAYSSFVVVHHHHHDCLLALDKTALLLYHLCFFATNYMNYLPLLSLGLTQILLYSIKISHFIHILSIQIDTKILQLVILYFFASRCNLRRRCRTL